MRVWLIVVAFVAALVVSVAQASTSAKSSRSVNTPSVLAGVEKALDGVKPFQASAEQVRATGRQYVCRWYDNAPSAQSADFSWQVRVCVQINKGLTKPSAKRKAGPKA